MRKSATSSLANALPFSHIYYEEEALAYPLAQRILSARPESIPVPIGHYKDLFNRSGQDMIAQKQAPSLILAVNRGELIYEGARVCQSFGYDYFYYCSNLYNCIFDCEYCYLQGMYPSGNIVVFVNTEDYFHRIEELLAEHPMYICISYDTDLLALEGLLGLVKEWSEFVLRHPTLTIEIRTKSCTDIGALKLPVCDRILYAYTLSPEPIASAYEHRTPSLAKRLDAIKKAQQAGYSVRLCFDPAIYVPDFETLYRSFIREVFDVVDASRITDVSIGVFRISSSYLKSMRKKRCCAITAYPYDNINGVSTYSPERSEMMLTLLRTELAQYIPVERLYETDF